MQRVGSYNYRKYIKRWLDVILALFILVATSPISIVVAFLIKFESKGPVVFVQQRTGLYGKNFSIYKFRTMTRDNNVLDFNKKNQMTKIGRIIRSLSIDELPQLINVLKGEMSFIGPRPWITEYYTNMNDNQRHRTDVLPGITGLAQVNGRNSISINQKINYDLEYVKNVSLLQDLKIAIDTVRAVFSRKGQEMEKSGIKDEIEVLKLQTRFMFANDIYDIIEGSYFKESILS